MTFGSAGDRQSVQMRTVERDNLTDLSTT